MMTRKECENLLSVAVQYSEVDEVFAVLNVTDSCARGVVGLALQAPHRMRNAELSVTVRKGRRYAMASGNVHDESNVRELVARAATAATQMPEAPEAPPFPGAVEIIEAPIQRETAITRALEGLDDAIASFRGNPTFDSIQMYGRVTSAKSALALASSNGLFLYQPSSLANAHLRCFSADGTSTGFAEQYTMDPAMLRLSDLLSEAASNCHEWKSPSDIKPGRITTVFEPRALADMLRPMMQQFSRRAIEQDQSFLRKLDGSSFLGSQLFLEEINLRSDPYDARLGSMPFTADGQPVRAESWITKGVISQLITDRYDAIKSGEKETAPPTNLIMDVTDPVQDVIAGTEYGLLVKGFANLNILDPKNCLLSGSTRDGVFLIEKGKITKAVRNLVIRETPVYLFKELLALGVPEITSTTGSYFPMLLPPIRVKDVMYTQLSGLV
ncbi:MAG: hypothetical protein IH600_14145 [Bacteroidetes bacterium]|nr:hypothetical protein [Bacteroidota bacterium]